ncbi:MAG TPA: SUMF1/EgtB/PvdO family nonheme iron enzyme [Chitinophagales bacterium]|nr:SUMF1/EgtB/PvdO family nonheme iron enzyme [Chitinophagales bacterium]
MKQTFILFFVLASVTCYAQKTKAPKRAPIDTTKFVLVEGGTFKMGTEKPVEIHEGPEHDVTVKSFYLAKTEVTFDDIDKWLTETKRDTGTVPSLNWGRGKMAAHMTSWRTAVEYCNWLSEKEKLSKCYLINGKEVTYLDTAKGYRLPTEAEWEFAARGGNKAKGTLFAGSDNVDEVAWYKVNSSEAPHQVAQKKPNELGLYDMNGNLWEWVWDLYDTYYYKYSEKSDPKGPATGDYRVTRGGAWYNYPNYTTIYTRQYNSPDFRQNSVGFRVARTYY